MIYEELKKKNKSIAVIGLGYVGLPLALKLSQTFSVVGYDTNEDVIDNCKMKNDINGEIKDFDVGDIFFTDNEDDLSRASFYIVCVPTPIDQNKKPNLKALSSVCEMLCYELDKGDYVVFESTVWPGLTEELCIPMLLADNGLKREDIHVAFSPERINPGDSEHSLVVTNKVVGGETCEIGIEVAAVYEEVLTEGNVHVAPSIKVAEMSKILENAQRDINIAFMNAMAIHAENIGVSIYDVLEASKTKWNFNRYTPGLVGGHCIGVDPYYLMTDMLFKGTDHHARALIAQSRKMNESMTKWWYSKIMSQVETGKTCLVLGLTFKPDVSDMRNSKALELAVELQQGLHVSVNDPFVPAHEANSLGFDYHGLVGQRYDVVVLAVPHKVYMEFGFEDLSSYVRTGGLFVDISGTYRSKVSEHINYLSL